jgi:steroid 5-alpha reductase family enzyme
MRTCSNFRVTKTAALVRVAFAYVVALGAAAIWLAWGPDTRWLWLDTLIADVLATVVIFGFSRAYRNSSFYDAYWSVIPPAIVIFWWASGDVPASDVRAWLATAVVMLWAIRLTGNWVYGWPGMHHEDWRYPMLREKSGRYAMVVDFSGIHLFPTLQVFLGTVPLYVVLTRSGRDVGWLDAVATLVGVGAVAIEFFADLQLHRFVRERTPGQVMDRGLWSWSRHPNYFGEIAFWVSLALFAVAAAPRDAWWVFAGAVAMLAMFLGASIPMMEERSLERRPSYQDVIDRVPMLIPRPPRKVVT